MSEYSKIRVHKGSTGWGGPLDLSPQGKKKYIVSVTGGGIHPVAKKMAELSGAKAVDSFKTGVEKEEMIAAVIDCGGTARCGTYPRMGVPTVNVKAMSPSGPLLKFMTEDIFVSGVTVKDIERIGEAEVGEEEREDTQTSALEKDIPTEAEEAEVDQEDVPSTGLMAVIDKIGRGAGTFINIMYQAGRDTIDTILKNIIPFLAFVATLIGIINYSGIGDLLANLFLPLANNMLGLIILSLITALPFLSPLLAPGAVIGAIIGTLIGNEIAAGAIAISTALPALFAINAQVGMDFIPVGLTLGEAKPDTISVGSPAVLFSRVITGPISVIIAYLISILMF